MQSIGEAVVLFMSELDVMRRAQLKMQSDIMDGKTHAIKVLSSDAVEEKIISSDDPIAVLRAIFAELLQGKAFNVREANLKRELAKLRDAASKMTATLTEDIKSLSAWTQDCTSFLLTIPNENDANDQNVLAKVLCRNSGSRCFEEEGADIVSCCCIGHPMGNLMQMSASAKSFGEPDVRVRVRAPIGCARPEWFSDGCCDSANDNDACEFDGGDCADLVQSSCELGREDNHRRLQEDTTGSDNQNSIAAIDICSSAKEAARNEVADLVSQTHSLVTDAFEAARTKSYNNYRTIADPSKLRAKPPPHDETYH